MIFYKMILYLLNSLIFSYTITPKSNEKIKVLFKFLNNFKQINCLINRYILKNKYSKTIF